MNLEGCVIALEGQSGVGKTTLLHHLQESKHPIVREYVVYAGGHSRFPPLFAQNHDQLRSITQYFVDLEMQRAIDIRGALQDRGYCFVDRSPLTHIAIQCATRILYPDRWYVDEHFVAQAFQQAADSGEIVLPSCYVHLKHPFTKCQSRMQGRADVPELFSDQTSVEAMVTCYDRFVQMHSDVCLVLESGKNEDQSSDIIRLGSEIANYLRIRMASTVYPMLSLISTG